MLKPDKEPIYFWLRYAESHLLWDHPEQFLNSWLSPLNAMGVPHKKLMKITF